MRSWRMPDGRGIAALLSVGALGLGLAACGSSSNENDSKGKTGAVRYDIFT